MALPSKPWVLLNTESKILRRSGVFNAQFFQDFEHGDLVVSMSKLDWQKQVVHAYCGTDQHCIRYSEYGMKC